MKLPNPILLPSPMQEREEHILPPFPFLRPGSKPLEEEEETMMMSDDGSGEKRRGARGGREKTSTRL